MSSPTTAHSVDPEAAGPRRTGGRDDVVGPRGTGRTVGRAEAGGAAAGSAAKGAAEARGQAAETRLFDGDTGRFELPLRQALVRLLRGPYLDGTADARLWQLVLDRRAEIAAYVSELFLRLEIDAERKIALLTPVEVDAPHTTAIAPRKPLKREETLLALRLRLMLDRHAGTGTDPVISRAGARDILEEHRQPGAVDDKRLEELTDASLARLLALKLILPTELPDEYRVSGALALALPFATVDGIPAYITAIERGDAALDLEPDLETAPAGHEEA
ncbi:DUF4194 domain-containing protein [Zhihengliuella sp.]|uniref:DUF4194 domain-containing protein n=1 Tax=Zhihengliuella sp. TaxID=1954483 RepID=UPI0028116602|nr:DUF4194 domain-containing protein [Zhihengliuella sp.]